MRQRRQARLREVKAELRRRMHDPIPKQGVYLAAVVRGHVQYYGVPRNGEAIATFRRAVCRLWRRALGRRSQNGQQTWERMERLFARWLPLARICHPSPFERLKRLGVLTQGRSPVR